MLDTASRRSRPALESSHDGWEPCIERPSTGRQPPQSPALAREKEKGFDRTSKLSRSSTARSNCSAFMRCTESTTCHRCQAGGHSLQSRTHPIGDMDGCCTITTTTATSATDDEVQDAVTSGVLVPQGSELLGLGSIVQLFHAVQTYRLVWSGRTQLKDNRISKSFCSSFSQL